MRADRVYVWKGSRWVVSREEAANFFLFLDRSHGPRTDVKVYIDGRLAAEGLISRRHRGHPDVKGFRFRLSRGVHTLKAVSRKGKTELDAEFEIKDKLWAVITYSRSARRLGFWTSETPISFL